MKITDASRACARGGVAEVRGHRARVALAVLQAAQRAEHRRAEARLAANARAEPGPLANGALLMMYISIKRCIRARANELCE